jgi:hypothetical protein
VTILCNRLPSNFYKKKRGINNKISAMLLLLVHQIDHTKVIGHMGELHGWTLMTWMKLKIENEIDHKGNKWMKLMTQLSHMIWHGFFLRCIFSCHLSRGWKQRISHKKFTYWWSWQYWWTSQLWAFFLFFFFSTLWYLEFGESLTKLSKSKIF